MIKSLKELPQLAKQKQVKTLAIAAAEDASVMNAIIKAKELGLIAPIFIGNKQKIEAIASEFSIKISPSEIIHSEDEAKSCAIAVKMVSDGKAHILMKGMVQTATLLKQVVNKEFGLLSGKLLSHLALFESVYYHKIFGLTDAAMNIAPTLDEKASIVENAVEAFIKLGVENPKVALLAAVEKVNPKMQATTDAAILKIMNERKQLAHCIIDGPLALDNAISREAAAQKGISGPVAGDADILVAPDINTGNAIYKCLPFLGGASCAAIITGSKAPIVLTSRADSEETKFLSIALGVLTSK
ncbi:MAG: bifunctional enoyl-CoA hydratase/phosphate acetyltransferase [Bacteroidales bacterium]|nr:bifunctional enoyl-CoA hydratase/phosphate acetyltransferase [Bacteroidales bacterium]